jgi:hypothetical protein
MAEPPAWWADPDELPEWMDDVFNDAQMATSNLTKWTLCIRMLDLTPTTQHVGLVLATYMDSTTLKAWPSVASLARDTGRKKTTVRESLRALEGQEWLAVQRFRNSRGDERISNRYFGRFPDADVKAVRSGGDGKVVELWQPKFHF